MNTEKFCAENIFVNSCQNEIVIRVQRERANIYRARIEDLFIIRQQALKFPEKLDMFWISQSYHDPDDEFMGPVDSAAFNKAVYSALKPGGLYVVLDRSAALGAPARM